MPGENIKNPSAGQLAANEAIRRQQGSDDAAPRGSFKRRRQGRRAPTPAKQVSLEWSEQDARLLERLLGPRRESVPNTRLRRSERVDIDAQLKELKKQLRETQETQELALKHLEALEETLKETSEASERMGRKDWALLAIGAFTTLVISVALPPATVVTITKLFIHNVAHLFSEELAGLG